jgi:GntR family transcriptional regulator
MLNTNSPIPLYFQLQEILRKKILRGQFKPGELIPTEKELQEKYGVSRITVRNAINGLVIENLLTKKQGRGTIVPLQPMLEDGNPKLQSFTEKMAKQGVKISSKVLDVLRIPATERITEHLRKNAGEEIIYLKRLRMVDEEPIALFENYICTSTGVNENDDFNGSIYSLFEEKNDIKISCAERTIEAGIVRSEDAQLLGIAEGDPILIISYITYDSGNNPIEYAEGIYRADRYKYSIRLQR